MRDAREKPVRSGAIAFLVLCAAFCASCGEDATVEEKPASPRERRQGGGDVTVEAVVDKARVDIGDRVVYTVKVLRGEGVEVDYPPVLDQFANWIIFDAGYWHDAPDVGTKKVRSLSVTLDPGIGPVLEIPPSEIKWRREGEDGWKSASTEKITVEVVSITEGAPEFREPTDLFELPEIEGEDEKDGRRTLAIVAAAALVILAAAAFLLFRKKKEREIPQLPAHEIAQRELAHLDALGLIDKGQIQEFYYRLTAILRRYIELRFGIMAPERTTEEFLVEMRTSRRLPREHDDVLVEFLSAADMVKYALHEPPTAETRRAFDTAERFIKVTIAPPGGADGAREEVGHAV